MRAKKSLKPGEVKALACAAWIRRIDRNDSEEQADDLGGAIEDQLGVAHRAAPDLALRLDGVDGDGVELAHDVG